MLPVVRSGGEDNAGTAAELPLKAIQESTCLFLFFATTSQFPCESFCHWLAHSGDLLLETECLCFPKSYMYKPLNVMVVADGVFGRKSGLDKAMRVEPHRVISALITRGMDTRTLSLPSDDSRAVC